MDTFARHLLVEYRGCPEGTLNNLELIKQEMNRAAVLAGATVVTSTFHRFAPQGVSGVVVIEESHISVHTWPEYGYASVDFFTCGDCKPELARDHLAEAFGADNFEMMMVHRGVRLEGFGMSVERHELTEASGEDDQEPDASPTPHRIAGALR